MPVRVTSKAQAKRILASVRDKRAEDLTPTQFDLVYEAKELLYGTKDDLTKVCPARAAMFRGGAARD